MALPRRSRRKRACRGSVKERGIGLESGGSNSRRKTHRVRRNATTSKRSITAPDGTADVISSRLARWPSTSISHSAVSPAMNGHPPVSVWWLMPAIRNGLNAIITKYATTAPVPATIPEILDRPRTGFCMVSILSVLLGDPTGNRDYTFGHA